jgi:hypothetical protein
MLKLLQAISFGHTLDLIRAFGAGTTPEYQRALRVGRAALREARRRYAREGLPRCKYCGGLLHNERECAVPDR